MNDITDACWSAYKRLAAVEAVAVAVAITAATAAIIAAEAEKLADEA